MSLRGGGEALQGGHTCRDRGVTPAAGWGTESGKQSYGSPDGRVVLPAGRAVCRGALAFFFLVFLAAVEEVCRLMRSGFRLRGAGPALLSIPGGMLLRMPARGDTQGQ